MIVASIAIKKEVSTLACYSVYDFIHEGHGEMVLLSLSIQLLVVHVNSPPDHWPHWNKIILFIRYHIHPTLFRSRLNRASLNFIYNRVNDPNISPLEDLFFNNFLHRRIQPFLVLHTGFVIRHLLDFF